MARRSKAVSEDMLVEGLRGIEERVEGLLETFEITSDKRLLRNVKESLKEVERGHGRTVKEILAELSRTKTAQ